MSQVSSCGSRDSLLLASTVGDLHVVFCVGAPLVLLNVLAPTVANLSFVSFEPRLNASAGGSKGEETSLVVWIPFSCSVPRVAEFLSI